MWRLHTIAPPFCGREEAVPLRDIAPNAPFSRARSADPCAPAHTEIISFSVPRHGNPREEDIIAIKLTIFAQTAVEDVDFHKICFLKYLSRCHDLGSRPSIIRRNAF